MKLFEYEGEFGYVCHTKEEFIETYELDAEEIECIQEADPERELTIGFDPDDGEPILPEGARVERNEAHPTMLRATAKVRDWIALYDEPTEIWTTYA